MEHRESLIFSPQRKQEIINLLEREPYVSVADLSARFKVSKAAVRRDLNELSKLGALERCYGGARKPPGTSGLIPLEAREVSNREEKKRIGKVAAGYIRPGDMIFIDAGTTTQYIVPHLADCPRLTVVTWSLSIINALVEFEDIDVIIVGGMLSRASLEVFGFLGLSSLEAFQIRCEKIFLSASAVSAQAGVMDRSLEVIPIKRKGVELSREVILLADSSKIGAVGAGQIVPAARINRMITGREAEGPEIARLRDLGVLVDLA